MKNNTIDKNAEILEIGMLLKDHSAVHISEKISDIISKIEHCQEYCREERSYGYIDGHLDCIIEDLNELKDMACQ